MARRVLIGAALTLALAIACQPADARPLSPTPYMGWDTYFAFGARYSEATVLQQASALLTSGLARRGYRYVWLDVGWWRGARDAAGRIQVSGRQWPHGLAWLARTLHAVGLRAGLYTDAGSDGCGGAGEPSGRPLPARRLIARTVMS